MLLLLVVLVIGFGFVGCDQASVAADNISTGADNFEVLRKVVFYNGITDEYMYAIEGYCSIKQDNIDNQLEVTCKTGEDAYVKHYLYLSDNITYMVIQLETVNVDTYHYRFILRPNVLIPDIEVDLP